MILPYYSHTGTGIFKLNVHKAIKKLIEVGKVSVDKDGTPLTYSLIKKGTITKEVTSPVETSKNTKTGKQQVAKQAIKEKDEATLTQEGSRDTSKFIFNKVAYPKSRLVLNLLKFHISKTPTISLTVIQALFKDIKSRYGILVPLAEAEKHARASGRYRHFTKPEDLIVLQGRKLACTNQWDKNSFHQFCVIISKTLKYQIKKQQ